MKQMMKRPLAFAGISFYIVSFLLSYSGDNVKLGVVIFAAAVVALLSVAAIFLVKYRGVLSVLSLISVFILGASGISYYAYVYKPTHFRWNDGNAHSVVAESGEAYYTSSYGSLQILKVKSVDGGKARFNLLCEFGGSSYAQGTLLTFDAELMPVADGYSGEELHSYMSDGVVACAYPKSVKAEIDRNPSLAARASSLSSKLSGILCSALGYKKGGFASALLLGNKTFIDPGVKNDFSRIGTAHLLAISGIHLTVISAYVSFIVNKLTKSRVYGALSSVIVAVVYSVLSGLSMSILRAAVMLTVASVGKIISKKSDMFTSLAIAAFGIVLVNPYAAGSISLMLSFAAVAGIGMYGSLKKEQSENDGKHKMIGRIRTSVLISLAAFAATLPASWLCFDEISVLSPLTNLIFIPLVSLILVILPVFLLLSPATALFLFVAKPLSFLITCTLELAEYFASFRHITVSTSIPTFPISIALIIAAFAVASLVSRSKRKYCTFVIAGAVALLFVSIFVARTASAGKTDIVMTAYSSNDELLVISDNKTLICDVSDGSYSSVMTAVDTMLRETYSELDAFMFTHYHQRHVTSLRKLLRRMNVDSVIIPLPVSETDMTVYPSLVEIAESHGCSVITYDREAPASIPFGNCMIEPTEYVTISRSSHPIISFAVTAYKNFAYLGGATNEKAACRISEKYSGYNVVCYGVHSPIYKKPLALSGSVVYYNERILKQEIEVAVGDGALPYSVDVIRKIRISD